MATADRIKNGTSVYYIQQVVEDQSAAPSSSAIGGVSESLATYSLVAATVVGTHKEAGAEPYYTIEISGHTHRELQTEWHRFNCSLTCFLRLIFLFMACFASIG